MTNVKNVSIKGFLAGLGIAPKTERGSYGMYLSPLREESTPSFKVDYGQNLWYDFGTGEGGSIIDLVARMENCTVGEAIRRLENGVAGGGLSVIDLYNRGTTIGAVDGIAMDKAPSSFHGNNRVAPQHPAPANSGIEIVSVGELEHPALVEYLNERGIDPATARTYCNEVRYRIGGREYFAIGFRNDAGVWELRNRNFKGSSTPKNITTIRNGSDTVMVFEGFIDFLSYLSLKQNPSPIIDTAVLNSVANLRRAIPFLETHRTIHAFLDNDEAGRKALADLRELLPGSEVVDQSPFYRKHKDLNDYWREQATDKIKRQSPTEHTNAAVQVRRSMSVKPVKKRGRGV
ncbi:MAG: toprim domain-containing protein [Alistipes sp.]|jgi:hypothetical protein|nr:toprim domain-containing protein [Alistipes sp.]